MKSMQSAGVLTPDMPGYPQRLREIKDHPKKMYYRGDVSLLNRRTAAVVGSRTTNQYGRSTAAAVSAKLAEHDVVVVSGMARGIDTCAHRGALDAGGGTIAVLGCGLDICYPAENRKLKEEIEKCGLLISEYPPGTEVRAYHFPQRNRIISGLSEIVTVVQARNRSGALITAELAADQGREVCAFPGNIDSQYNLGNNKLIREGACPLLSISDVLDVMGIDRMDEEAACSSMSVTEQKIFSMIREYGEMTVDEICIRLSKPPSYVTGIVAVMEMKGFVFSALGKIFVAKG